MSDVHDKEKYYHYVADLIHTPDYHYGAGILNNLCKDTEPLLEISLLKEDYQANKK